MKVNKVQPIQYSPYEYWKKYNEYGHRILHRYTSNLDIHEDFDSRLYICLEHLLRVADYSKICKTYITKTMRNLCKKIKQFGIYTYKHEVDEIHLEEHEFNKIPVLDTNIDDFIEKKFVNHILNKLNDRQRQVLKMIYGISPYKKRMIKEIANDLNVSETRVHAIRNQALKNLRKILIRKNIYNVEDFIYG